jgi:hypothetical protein
MQPGSSIDATTARFKVIEFTLFSGAALLAQRLESVDAFAVPAARPLKSRNARTEMRFLSILLRAQSLPTITTLAE